MERKEKICGKNWKIIKVRELHISINVNKSKKHTQKKKRKHTYAKASNT